MNRILSIGFTYAGSWSMSGNGIQLELNHYSTSKNILYAFISDGQVRYIGKTTQPLTKRLYGYQNPGATQSTNIKNNRNISQTLSSGGTVDIFVLPDNGLLHYGGFHVNLAAGLEDSLIEALNPDWNGGKPESSETAGEEGSPKPDLLPPESSEIAQFQLVLGEAYFNQGFINVPVKLSSLLGPHGAELEIFLGTSEQPLLGYINRTATGNGTPRLMGGAQQKAWIQSHFQKGEKILVQILGLYAIRINPCRA